MPGLGTLPADWLDLPLLPGALRSVSRGAALPTAALRYGEPAGDARLRQALAHRLADLGVAADARADRHHRGRHPGAGHGLAHAAAPGDAVLVDEPGWAVEFARLARAGHARAAGAARRDGPDLAVMQRAARARTGRACT